MMWDRNSLASPCLPVNKRLLNQDYAAAGFARLGSVQGGRRTEALTSPSTRSFYYAGQFA
jgi:hypothetical protein